jgi:hypothetical protein
VKSIRVSEEDLLYAALRHFVLAEGHAVLGEQSFDRGQVVGVQGDVGVAGLNFTARIAGPIVSDDMNHQPIVKKPGAGKFEVGARNFTKAKHVAIEFAAGFQATRYDGEVVDRLDWQWSGHCKVGFGVQGLDTIRTAYGLASTQQVG